MMTTSPYTPREFAPRPWGLARTAPALAGDALRRMSAGRGRVVLPDPCPSEQRSAVVKFRVERDVLSEAVAWVVRGLSNRPPVPVLAGVLLTADEEGTLTFLSLIHI